MGRGGTRVGADPADPADPAEPGVPADGAGDPVGLLLMRRGARASPLVDLAVAGDDDEMVLSCSPLVGGGRGWRRGFLGCHFPAKSFGVGLSTDAVRLCILDGGRVALHPNTKGEGQVKPFLVGEA